MITRVKVVLSVIVVALWLGIVAVFVAAWGGFEPVAVAAAVVIIALAMWTSRGQKA